MQKTGTTLGTKPIFPTNAGSANNLEQIHLRKIEGSENIMLLDLEYTRSAIFGKDQTVMRTIPLNVTISANKLTDCSASDSAFNGSSGEDGTPGTDGDSLGAANAKFGNCDQANLPGPTGMNATGGAKPKAPNKDVAEARDRLCSALQYPVPNTGKISCKSIAATNFDLAHQVFKKRYGISCSDSVASRTPSSQTSDVGAFAGLKSEAECKKLPIYPMGSSVESTEMLPQGTFQVKYNCINGRWISLDN